jgi:hypothetical protein
MMARFLDDGLQCFRLYCVPLSPSETLGKRTALPAQQKEERDVLEHFASIFTVLDQRSFRDVFSAQVGAIRITACIYPLLLHVTLLTNYACNYAPCCQ